MIYKCRFLHLSNVHNGHHQACESNVHFCESSLLAIFSNQSNHNILFRHRENKLEMFLNYCFFICFFCMYRFLLSIGESFNLKAIISACGNVINFVIEITDKNRAIDLWILLILNDHPSYSKNGCFLYKRTTWFKNVYHMPRARNSTLDLSVSFKLMKDYVEEARLLSMKRGSAWRLIQQFQQHAVVWRQLGGQHHVEMDEVTR